jgi:hypothetical protein
VTWCGGCRGTKSAFRLMSSFFFDLTGGPVAEIDLPNVQQAKREATRYLGEVIRDQGEGFWATSDLILVVSNENGLVLFTLEVVGNDAPALKLSMPMPT